MASSSHLILSARAIPKYEKSRDHSNLYFTSCGNETSPNICKDYEQPRRGRTKEKTQMVGRRLGRATRSIGSGIDLKHQHKKACL